jgi:hemoglobin/transferrin/lactoferrin receptor protein
MRPYPLKKQIITSLTAALFAMSTSIAFAQDNNDDEEATEEESVELSPVVVVGSRVEQNIEDIAGSISVMTSKDIDDQMVTNMSQLFRYEPGINITGSNGTAQNFVVRGMGADRVMMIKDGMRMNEGYGANGLNDVVGRGFIDMDTVKQVEVAKGAASSLYGADAMGGIVAFSTKDASDLVGAGENFYISANGDYDGRSDEFGAGLLTAFRLGNWETLISYKGRKGHETQNYDETRDETNVDSNSLLLKTDYIIDNAKKLTLSYDYYLQEVERPDDGLDKGDYLGLGGWQINEESSYNEKENNAYKVRYQDKDSGWAFMDNLDINLYLNKTDQRDESLLNHDTPPPLGPGGSRDTLKSDLFQQETWGLSLSSSKLLGTERTHQLSYGFDWDTSDTFRPRRETRTQSDGTVSRDDLTAPFPKNTTERLGIYLQDTIQLTDKWSVIPGARYDYYKMKPKADEGYDSVNPGDENAAETISDDNVSWRLGTVYKFTDSFSAYFQYAQGFKVPPYDLAYFYFDHVAFCDFSVFTCFGTRIIPADDLVPEESDSFEIGVRGNIGNFSYNLSAYRNDYDNFIQIVYVESIDGSYFGLPLITDVFQYQNIDSAEISGYEFRFDYYLGKNVSMFLNGEWMDSEDKTTGDQLATIQPFNGTLGLNYYRGSFSMDAMLKWADDMDKNPEGTFTTDSYTTVDLFARYDFNDRFMISAGVLNMFDEEYIEYSRIAGIPDNGRDLTPFTETGRTFSASLKFVF